MRALIVDDEPTVRLLLSRILRREVDCVVTEATNGIEALDLLARHHFDFVVLDVMMPVMGGLETLKAIRGTPDLRHLPVMVLSSVRDETQVRQLVALGVSAYLTKPLRPTDASARVQRFVASFGYSAHSVRPGQGRTPLGLSDGARVLVVDGDADFRHFVRSTLGQRYLIIDAEDGAQGLRACLAARPAVILLGQNLGALAAPMFMHKLRSLPDLATVPVIVAGSRGVESLIPDTDAFIARTFVPETFTRQFERLIVGGSPEQRVLLSRPELRPQVMSAAEQVFGMMLGVEVSADAADMDRPMAGADLATVVLTLPDEGADLEFGISTARDISERMTALMLQDADVVSEEDVSSTLQEIANIIGGRLQSALRARGDRASLGLPTVTSLAEDLVLEDGWACVGFHDAAGDIRFGTYLRPVARASRTAEASACTAAL